MAEGGARRNECGVERHGRAKTSGRRKAQGRRSLERRAQALVAVATDVIRVVRRKPHWDERCPQESH